MKVPTNELKSLLKTDQPLYGIFNGLPDPYAAEICAGAGFDWVLVDGEHGPFDTMGILHQIQAMKAFSIPILVRPAKGEEAYLKPLLDIGVQSFLVPMIESVEQAREVIRCTRYAPEGKRGVGTGLSRAAQWNRIENYFEEAADHICLLLQLESVEGMAQLKPITALEEVDAVFIGPADLSASMGYPGNPDHPEVKRLILDSIQYIRGEGKAAGVFALSPQAIEEYQEAGANVIAVGADSMLLAAATAELARSCKALLPKTP